MKVRREDEIGSFGDEKCEAARKRVGFGAHRPSPETPYATQSTADPVQVDRFRTAPGCRSIPTGSFFAPGAATSEQLAKAFASAHEIGKCTDPHRASVTRKTVAPI